LNYNGLTVISSQEGTPLPPSQAKDSGDLFIRSVFARYLGASTIALVGSSLGIVGSSAIVGSVLGADLLSVLSLALPFYYLFAAVGSGIGIGGAQVCARLIGWQRHEDCQRAFSLVYLLAVVLGLVLSVALLLLLDPLLELVDVSAGLTAETHGYLRTLCAGGTFIIGIYPAFNLLRLDGQTTGAALLFILMGVLYLLLDFLFLVGFGWGIDAVALAMCIAYGLSALIGALLLMHRSLNFRFVLPWRLRGERVRALLHSIVTTGSPNALENISIVVRTATINSFAAAAFGAVALDAYALVDDVTTTALVLIAGTSGAAMAFLGVFIAERDSRNTAKILRLSFIWGLPSMIVLTLALEIFAPEVVVLFGADVGVETTVFSTAVRVFALGLPFFFFNYLMITVYQSQRRVAASNAIVLARELGPLLMLVLLSGTLGMTDIWVAFPATEILTMLGVLLYSHIQRRRNRCLMPVFLVDQKIELEGESISLLVRNNPRDIVCAVESVAQFCKQRQLGGRTSMVTQLALEEMLSVIGEHALAGAPKGMMNVRVLTLGSEVIVRIRNGGVRFNPIQYVERSMRELAEVPEGRADASERVPMESMGTPAKPIDVPLGLMGAIMILKLAEVVDYRPTFGVNNLMIIIRE
jgi:Na+-driven multidrug efflux pump/anti-sigma regulatory factor (Ser/Thr protein kinase)